MKILTAIARTAARLCDAHDAQIYLVEDATMRLVAQHGSVRTTRRLGEPFPVSRGAVHGRAALTRRVIHVRDLKTAVRTQYPELAPRQRATGARTILAAPLLSDGAAVGVIMIRRAQVNPFTDRQIALLKTFADQAVIAIENVRLFTELQEKNRALTEAHGQVTEALERQTATSEILRAIAHAQTDVQPVFDTIVESAARLCHAANAAVFLTDGRMVHHPANYGSAPEAMAVARARFPRPLDMDSVPGMVILTRSAVHVPDTEEPSAGPLVREAGRLLGFRSTVAVPMLREGEAIGSINVARREPGRFSDGEVELLKTFADQAVIAIENTRLFNETTEALEQQTATSEILRVISSSPTDVQPVFDVIVEQACRLCDAVVANAVRIDGDLMRNMAAFGFTPEAQAVVRRSFPMLPSRATMSGRAILDRAVVASEDASIDEVGMTSQEISRSLGCRAMVSVPMLRDGIAVGAITLGRREPGRFPERQVNLLRSFAHQAVIAIENVRLFKELEEKNQALTKAHAQVTEALEQQTATAEILRVIGASPTDAHPVFEAIARSGVRVCGALSCAVFVVDGEMLRLAATHGVPAARIERFRSQFPAPLTSPEDATCAVRERSMFHMADIENNPAATPGQIEVARLGGYCTRLMVPMLRGDNALGLIAVTSAAPTPFPERQVELLQTFADQAVIAIENVRLFTELQERNSALTVAHAQVTESLEQQTATSEILRVISSSPTDLQPVLDTVVASAARYCGAYDATMLHLDGGSLRLAAHHGPIPIPVGRPIPVVRGTTSGRAVLERRAVHVTDIQAEAEEFPESRAFAKELGYRTQLSVPLLREGAAIGTIVLRRIETNPFTDKQIALLQTFADQAVIAIENVRLFKELEVRNRDLVEALDRQTATSEILRVISGSRADLEPVFDVIVRNAVRLCGASHGGVYRFDGELVHSVAHDGYTPEQLSQWRATWPKPVAAPSLACRAIETRTSVRASDFETAAELIGHSPETIANLRARGTRSVMAVPMFRRDEVIGAISLAHCEVDAFSDTHLELLKTFADQAVIAIENARLLKELEGRTHELTRSVGELRALGEVGQAISSTLDLETVLSTIVSRAVELSGLDGGVVFEYDERAEEFMQRAAAETGGILAQARRGTRYRKGEGVVGRTALTLEPVQMPDISVPGAYVGRMRENLIDSGIRALLAVPMVREDRLIGCLVVSRNRPGDFPAETIELLRTFATQSALAIQNARLFLEIADKSRQLEAASQHKSEFLANMSHELRTPLNAILGFSEVLAQGMFGAVNEKQAEYLHDILESGRHLLSLINDILDLSKIEAGRMELELSEFDLPQAIQNALTLVRERALHRGIALHHVIDDRVADIRADERKIKQVLLNLLSNAIKFTPEGGRIEVRAASTDGLVEVSVADTGIGIAPGDQETVFEEFRQVGTADRKAEGTGLGLALSRKFIELHGGRIWLTSQVGVGSTFTFTLPVR